MSAILNQYCYFGPYNDLSTAYAAIPVKYRYGKVFGIIKGTTIDSFWWKDSANLIDGAEVIRTSGSLTLDPDVAIYVANILLIGGSISLQHKVAINTFVTSLKTNNIWNELIEIYVPLGDNLFSAGVKLKCYNSTSYHIDMIAGSFVEEDYSPTLGLSSSTNNKYLDTRFIVDESTPIVKGAAVYVAYNSSFTLFQGVYLDPVMSLIASTGNFQWYIGNLNAIGVAENTTYIGGLFNQLSSFDVVQNPTYNFVHGIRQSADLNSVYRNGALISSTTIHDEITTTRPNTLILNNFIGNLKSYSLDTGNLTNDQIAQYHIITRQLMYDLGREEQVPLSSNDGLHGTLPVIFTLT